LVAKWAGIDVLWKSPWGLPAPGGVHSATDSAAAWLEAYEGGWQEIFPNGGTGNPYRGGEPNFPREPPLAAWDSHNRTTSGETWEVLLATRLRRSPFRIERTMRVAASKRVLHIQERLSNVGREALEAIWGHHPAFGAPFLSGACRIDTNARTVIADDMIGGPL